MDRIDEIIESCGEVYILDLLQEECAELIQAASKVKRLMKGEKQLSPLEVRANFVEELADVRLMIKCARRLLTPQEDIDMIVTETRKERRFEKRTADGGDKSYKQIFEEEMDRYMLAQSERRMNELKKLGLMTPKEEEHG